MSNELLKIVLKETFLSWDLLLVIVIPLIVLLAVLCFYRGNPLGSSGAWNKIGHRFAVLGTVFALSSMVVYLACAVFCHAKRDKHDKTYSSKLSNSFREYFNRNKDFTQRMMDFAERVADVRIIRDQIDNFATNLPPTEREQFGRTWVAGNGKWGGIIISGKRTIDKLSEILYWDDEKIGEYEKENRALPALSTLRYTPEQIEEYKKSNWPRLFPLLENDQWICMKNQILMYTETRRSVMACLRDTTDCFQKKIEGSKKNETAPTKELSRLYEEISNKACPTQAKKVEVYLMDRPAILKFYNFSLAHRWWFRTALPAGLFLLIGVIMLFKGRAIAADGARRNLFK